jgi:arylamine N-acetyltransferase
MVLIVSFEGPHGAEELYHADVGFGGGNPIHPIPLKHEAMVPGLHAAESHRVINTPDPRNCQTITASLEWQLQHCPSSKEDWKTLYTFITIEFHPEDYEVVAHGVNTMPGSLFLDTVLMVQLFRPDGPDSKSLGRWALFRGELKKRVGESEEIVRRFEFEEDIAEAIKEAFGIELSSEEIDCMKGRNPALPRRGSAAQSQHVS